jgi:NADH-quinone oxidoreductase subunit C
MKAIELLGKGEEMNGRAYVKIGKSELEETIKTLKENGYNHFVMLSCIDWLDDGEFELVYHLWNYEEREHVMLSVRVARDGESMPSMHELFPQIETYEREIHEMYGIKFDGNPRLTPFFLEGWRDMPPMRKDFDSRKFTEDVFGNIPIIEEEEDEGI